jgi:hypothetical protein
MLYLYVGLVMIFMKDLQIFVWMSDTNLIKNQLLVLQLKHVEQQAEVVACICVQFIHLLQSMLTHCGKNLFALLC